MLLLSQRNKILFTPQKIGILGFLFCVVVSLNALGQEERVRTFSDSPGVYEGASEGEGAHLSTADKNNGEIQKKVSSPAPKKENKEHIYKQKGEKDMKNEGLSTLSFNLFLYVVDRFKEDN